MMWRTPCVDGCCGPTLSSIVSVAPASPRCAKVTMALLERERPAQRVDRGIVGLKDARQVGVAGEARRRTGRRPRAPPTRPDGKTLTSESAARSSFRQRRPEAQLPGRRRDEPRDEFQAGRFHGVVRLGGSGGRSRVVQRREVGEFETGRRELARGLPPPLARHVQARIEAGLVVAGATSRARRRARSVIGAEAPCTPRPLAVAAVRSRLVAGRMSEPPRPVRASSDPAWPSRRSSSRAPSAHSGGQHRRHVQRRPRASRRSRSSRRSLLQLEASVKQRLGPRRAARDVHVHGQDRVDAREHVVGVGEGRRREIAQLPIAMTQRGSAIWL